MFSIKKKNLLYLYFSVFNSCKFSSHFGDTFFHLLHFTTTHLNVNCNTNNTQLTLYTSNPILNNVNVHNIVSNGNNFFPVKILNITKSNKYNVTLRRRKFS